MFATHFLDIPPLASAGGTVVLPGSKSISNRVLLLSALSLGTTTLHDLLDSDDTRVMLDALKTLGCGVRQTGTTVEIDGLGGQLSVKKAALFMGNAGTAIRPLTAALAVMGGDYALSGVPRMHERPIGDLVDALRQLGCRIDYLGQDGFPPLHIGEPHLTLGAPIKASASGMVTYAGNELKDYGNLVLIKHSGGYTTAYAHADRLLVSRGENVSRGQVIGYAGQTGDVSAPQLHFEIRAAATPVNPRSYLSATTASN